MKCKWNTGEKCEGDVKLRDIDFGFVHNPLPIQACMKHYLDHKTIIALTEIYGLDLEKVLVMTYEEREEKVAEFKNLIK